MFSFASLLGFSVAIAGPAQDIAAEFSEGQVAPAFGLACAPLRETVRFGDALGTFANGTDSPELQLLLEAARNPDVDTVEGIDVDGAFAMVAGPSGASAILPVRGSLEDAMAVFLRPTDDPERWTVQGDTATFIDPDGTERTLTVDGTRARLTVSPSLVPRSEVSAVPPPALTDLPDAKGCALWIQPPAGDASTPALLRNPVALWVPFDEGEPLRLHVQLPPHRDRKAAPDVQAPVVVRGPQRPQAVMTLGVPALSILRDPVVQDSLPPMVRAGLPEAGFADDVGAGLVVGTFFGPQGPSIVAVVPIEKKSGRPVSARRIWRITSNAVVEAQKGRVAPPPERLGRRSLQVQVTPRHALTMVARRGQLVVGNVRGEVEGVARDEGVVWLDDTAGTWASDHAFALFGELPVPGLNLPMSVQVGAGTRGDVLELQLLMDPGLNDPRVAAALRALTASRRASGVQMMPVPAD